MNSVEHVLIVDDDRTSRDLLSGILEDDNRKTIAVGSAEEALELLKTTRFSIAVVDRVLPGIDGLELCRRIRASENGIPLYIIVVTAKNQVDEILEGFSAGADDYMVKPFAAQELLARIKVGEKMVHLQQNLEEKVTMLEEALEKVESLEGIIPICSYCKKIRDDKDYWDSVEEYMAKHSKAQFSHSICPDCMVKYYGDLLSEEDMNNQCEHDHDSKK